MYRAVAWKALQEGICLTNGQALTEIAQNHTISFGHEEGNPVPKRVFVMIKRLPMRFVQRK